MITRRLPRDDAKVKRSTAMIATLPVLMALSWVPVVSQPIGVSAPDTTEKATQPAQAADAIRCPITGQQIPACCCPIKN